MPFRNAHVEHLLGHGILEYVHGATRRHGGSHSHYQGILFRQLQQSLAKHSLILRWHIPRLFRQPFTRIGIKLPWRVPYGSVLLRRLISHAFRGVQMQQLGTRHILQLPKDAHDFLYVMSVEGAEIAYVHALKDILLPTDDRFQSVVQAQDDVSAVVVENSLTMQPATGLKSPLIVSLVGIQLQQVFLHSSHGAVYAHVVVVEDNEQIVGRGRDIVKPLKSQTTAHGSIAYHGYHPAVIVPCFFRGHGHAQRRRDGIRSVAADKTVILAFHRSWERPDAVQLSVRAEGFPSSCQYLVPVGLVSHVPHDTIVRRIIYIM